MAVFSLTFVLVNICMTRGKVQVHATPDEDGYKTYCAIAKIIVLHAYFIFSGQQLGYFHFILITLVVFEMALRGDIGQLLQLLHLLQLNSVANIEAL